MASFERFRNVPATPAGDQQLTVSNATGPSLGLTVPNGSVGAILYVNTEAIRVRFAADPTGGSVGILVSAGESLQMNKDEIDAARMIRNAGADADVFVQYYS